ncbi:MAG: diguanylate cyclase, partial [Solirubrobacteraceae bacterium]
LPHWATTVLFCLTFVVAAAALTVPWRTNDDERRKGDAQRKLIDDQLAVAEIVVGLTVDGRVNLISDHGLELLGFERADVMGQDWVTLVVDPDQHETARRGLAWLMDPARTPVVAPHFYQYEHAIIVGDASRRVFRWRTTLTMDGGEITGTMTAGIDITDQRHAERQLLREQRDLVHLQQIAQAVARETDARESVVEGIMALVDARCAGLFEPTASGDALVLTRANIPELIGARIPLDGTPSANAFAFKSAEPFFVSDAENHPLVSKALLAQTDARSFLYQPVIVDDTVAGVLVVGWQEQISDLGDRHTNLVALAADEAASALQRLAAMKRWEEAALTDVLTGIPNRRAFDHMFDDAIRHAQTADQPLALALMDLNGFKTLNDTEGHAAGDRVLKESAALWLNELRPTDVLARLGGDEFAVLLPNCGADDIESVAGRLRRALRHEAGCGVGIEVWDREESGSELMHRVDQALYADKAAGARARLADPNRLAAVEATQLLDREADPELDALTQAVTALVGVPRSTITLVTHDRQFFASQCGNAGTAAPGIETPLSHSYCQHPATTGRELVIEDAREHPLLKDNLATTEVGLRAYVGIPLMAGGETFGVLCALDDQPRTWSQDDLGALRSVARRATSLIAAKAARA